MALAIAAVQGDLEPLLAEAGTLDPTHPLVGQVHALLRSGGAESVSEWLENVHQMQAEASSVQ